MSVPPPPPPIDADDGTPRYSPKKILLLSTASALTIGLLAGMGIGYAAYNPTSSQEYRAIQAEYENLESQLEKAKGEVRDATEENRQAQIKISDRELAASKKASENLTKQQELQALQDELKELEKEFEKREEDLGIAEKKREATLIREGVWTVGVDVKPGTYRLVEAFDGDMCYWSIERTGSNGSIIQNDVVTGGRPSVKLSKGQDFTSQGCGIWEPVK